jgi:hypothetical protein
MVNVTDEQDTDIVASMSEIDAANDVEYKVIPGFKDGQSLRIGSLSAGDLIEWSEANQSEAKKTAGLRLITKSLVGPEPENIRYADDPKYIAVFRRKTHKRTEAVVDEILKLNGLNIKNNGKTAGEEQIKNA